MLPLQLNLSLRTKNLATRSCVGGNHHWFKYIRENIPSLSKLCSCSSCSFCKFGNWSLPANGIHSVSEGLRIPGSDFRSNLVPTPIPLLARTLVSQALPKDADVFGDLGSNRYRRVPLTEEEELEEDFVNNESKLPRRERLSPGQYAQLIKSHIEKGDLDSALGVLDLAKSNRDKPTAHMYNLLIRGYAQQGHMRKCFKLYNDMKKRALKVGPNTYTSLFSACANAPNSEKAIEKVDHLRRKLIEKGYELNETNYNVMARAYGVHNRLLEAFQIVDEMRDKHIPVGEMTFNTLLHGSISDKEAGLRHALVIWHLMKHLRVVPTVVTYNLLLRAIRDTKLGDLKTNDTLIANIDETKLQVQEGTRPDLLASPPVISTLLISPQRGKAQIKESVGDKEVTGSQDGDKALEVQFNKHLNEILVNNRLILFGGFEGMLRRMEEDGVHPNTKTITLLLDLAPPTLAAEEDVLKAASELQVELDIDFFNMLIKKRSLRYDYKNAKKVFAMIQQRHLQPDIVTWGVLALGCTQTMDVQQLLDGMETTGFSLNAVIAGTIIRNACRRRYFNLIVDMMNIIVEERVRPNEQLLNALADFQNTMSVLSKGKDKTGFTRTKRFKEGFALFSERYSKFLEEVKYKKKSKPQEKSKPQA